MLRARHSLRHHQAFMDRSSSHGEHTKPGAHALLVHHPHQYPTHHMIGTSAVTIGPLRLMCVVSNDHPEDPLHRPNAAMRRLKQLQTHTPEPQDTVSHTMRPDRRLLHERLLGGIADRPSGSPTSRPCSLRSASITFWRDRVMCKSNHVAACPAKREQLSRTQL